MLRGKFGTKKKHTIQITKADWLADWLAGFYTDKTLEKIFEFMHSL